MEQFLLFAALVVLVFGVVSAWIPKTIVTAPMFFVASGMVFSLVSDGARGGHEILEELAELTLVVLLFTDASRINARKLMGELGFPIRLLGIGLPLTVLLGAVVAKLVLPEFTFAEATLLAAILAPTDAALGQAVVNSKQVPLRIRQALNVESGLNDGLIVPIVLLFAAMAAMPTGSEETTNWFLFWLKQVTLGPLAGVATAWLGSRVLEAAAKRGMVSTPFMKLAGIAMAVLAWATANSIGGNGFIAAFIGGMTIGCTAHGLKPAIQEFGEVEGQLFSLLTFSLFGATLVIPALNTATSVSWLYAILSLTLIRIVPVAIALIRTKAHHPTILFMGWFGPRGLASLIFALLVTSEHEFPHEQTLFNVVIVTSLLSVLAHGLTAVPATAWYGRWMDKSPSTSCEHEGASEYPLRYDARAHEDSLPES